MKITSIWVVKTKSMYKIRLMFTKTLGSLLVALLLLPQPVYGAWKNEPMPSPEEESQPQPAATTSTTKSNPSTTPTPTIKTVTSELSAIRILVDSGKYTTALTSLKSADKSYPNNADVNNLLGYTSRKLKQYTQAGTYYTKALKIDSKHLGALEYQGELFMILKKTSSAKSNLAKIKAICGTSCEEYIDLKKAIGNK
jgi:tetratricopeptide (TPR) repeat protein